MKKYQIGYIGLTHLGLTYLTASAIKNNRVIAFDNESLKIKNLNKNSFVSNERGLVNKLISLKKKILFTDNIKDLNKCDMIFISCDIETNSKNESNYFQINKYLNNVKRSIKKNIPIIILSQVKPGFTRLVKLKKFKVYYQVETLIFGNAIKQALKPKRIIVGKKNMDSKIDAKYFNFLKSFHCPIIEMKYESAELCKIAINILLASNLIATNTLANLAEELKADFYDLIPALKLDPRIGKKSYIYPGLGISGGNIERDIVTVKKLVKEYKIKKNHLMSSFQEISENRKIWTYDIIKKISKRNKISKIGIFGFTYKKDNSSCKNSPTVKLISRIKKPKLKIEIYDDLIDTNKFKSDYTFKLNEEELIKGCDLIIFMRNFKNIKTLSKIKYSKLMKKNFIIDPFGILKQTFENKKEFKYYRIGK